nr:phage integrase SAM-like domain-containing protein [Rhodoferax sp.]
MIAFFGVQHYAEAMLYQFPDNQIHAANDAVMRTQKRCRTVPIPSTITAIPGYPNKLAVFKIAASKFWQVRCWITGRTHRRSTQTQSLRGAQSFARQFYELLLAKHYIGSNDAGDLHDKLVSQSSVISSAAPVKPKHSFGALAAQMFANEQCRQERGEITIESVQVMRNRLDAHILTRWAKVAPASIDYQALLDFTQFLSASLSTITVSQYLLVVRKVLKHAIAIGALDKLPQFPRIKITTNSRGAFTPTEYWMIARAARRLRGVLHPECRSTLRKTYKLRHADQHMPPDVAWVVVFMVNSFIRPSDLWTLKHKHVEVLRGQNTYLRLTLPETKKHDKPIVTLQPAVRIYEQISKHYAELSLANPDDYLFLPHLRDRSYANSVLSLHFNWVLADTGLKHGVNGQPRTLYSLRHSAITFRLLYGQGIDLLTLARNARTSVDVINNHYASTVTGEQNIGLLQSRRNNGARTTS